MWLRRLVGIFMIVTCVSMISLAAIGVFSPEKKVNVGFNTFAPDPNFTVPPTVTISADPGSTKVGYFSTITWSTTGDPTDCEAKGSWSGQKTAFGTESTGRITTEGEKVFSLVCKNKGGSSEASVKIAVAAASAPAPTTGGSKGSTATSSSSGPSYCSGRLPCYGPREVGQHSGSGNCWGWNGDRVINISGFDLAFHQAKTGISSIEVGQVCGHNLAPSLSGGVSAGGQTRDHNATTKANADRNEIPYFVGYFDGSKP